MATRFTIRRNGMILGTYPAPGGDESEALNAQAKEEGFTDFKDLCAKKKVSRDDHKVEAVAD